MPKSTISSQLSDCLCGKSKRLKNCCGRFISGNEIAKTPEQLMRSRYTAYALSGHGEYLLQTWLPESAHGISAQQLSKQPVIYQRLEILQKTQLDDKATVEFKAHFIDPANVNKVDVLHETSVFQRVLGRWFYVTGSIH